MTLYLGAGGGGDTNAAVMCALADTSPGKKLVLGAGYSLDEYTTSFKKEQKNRKTGAIDRNACTNSAFIDSYLKESLKNYKDDTALNTDTDVWRLNDTEQTAMIELFNAVKPEEVPYDDAGLQQRHGSYKYQGLLEERLLLRKLKEVLGDNDVLNNIYISYTTSNWKDTIAINKSYNALKDFITTKTVQKIVLMDFGGDLIQFTKAGRDPIVLLNCLRLLKDPLFQNLTVEVWIYGLGVDSHALPGDVETNLNKFAEITMTGVIDPVNITPLLDFIKNNSDLLEKIDILGLNRATGNWYEAYNNCVESSMVKGGARRKNKKQGGGVTIEDYIEKGLKTRTEYTGLKTEDDKTLMSTGWATFFITPETAWCKLAKTYKFILTKSLNDNGMFWPHIQSIQPTFPLEIFGGKPKDLKKTAEKVKVGKRDAVVYATPRGAKYVVIKGSYIKVKDIAKTLKNLQKNK